ncbi:hypothetical protein L226DRAFT_612366 [Lentinus tigrinus ALCF2SS1-7]|uniref:F-box domain-containing protein n=1 Tax=Lentinus tigrinus ALCF2SS1-6 TaxID=1328759 RepID=A0A5C2SD29_9APHY|nr:hypothetical protein L227DRAFT_55685 [Lentinus tigrinus ALCF2SS1-6]RPD76131.1 hypothetical protein L226DRAFT_612366 [Lentinus tigrinus ALCF2SS1-7]
MVDSSSRRPPLPPDDLALLAGLPPPELGAAAESRIQVYRKMIEDMNGYIFQLISIQNTTVPLHATLPPEVLLNVFRHVSPTRRADIRLTHVCKLWRDLIHRTPEFWADMLGAKAVASRLDYHESNTPLSLTTFIERSSPAPYKLNLYEDLSILTKIPSHISRIYSLSRSWGPTRYIIWRRS